MPEPVSEDGRLEALRLRWERDPGSRIFLQLAEEYRRHGKLSEAVRTLEKGLATQPGYLSARVALGRCRLELGDAPGACTVLETVLASDPTQLVANKLLIEAYVRTARPDKARDRLDLYLLLNESDPEIGDLERRVLALEKTPPPQDALGTAGREAGAGAPAPVAGKETKAPDAAQEGRPAMPVPRAAGEAARSSHAAPLALPTPTLGALDLAAVPLPARARRIGSRGASELPNPFPMLPRSGDRIRLVRSLAAEGIFRQTIGTAQAVESAERLDPVPRLQPWTDEAWPHAPVEEPQALFAEPLTERSERPLEPAVGVADFFAPPAAATETPAEETAVEPADDRTLLTRAEPEPPQIEDPAPVAEPSVVATGTPPPSPWWKIPAPPVETQEPPVEAERPIPPENAGAGVEIQDVAPAAFALEAPEAPIAASFSEPVGQRLETVAPVDPAPAPPRGGRSISSADATATLAELYLQQGHIDEAEKSFRSVLARDPGNLQAAAGLDEVSRRRRQIGARTAAQPVPLGLTARKIRALQGYLERIREGARRHVS